jgi:hypothetical protein
MIQAYVAFQSHFIIFVGVLFWHCQLLDLIVVKLPIDGGCISHYLKSDIIQTLVDDCDCLLIIPSHLVHDLPLGKVNIAPYRLLKAIFNCFPHILVT